MSTVNLDSIFAPKRIAIVGASDTPTSVGYTILKKLVGSGFDGVIYPVNPRRESVQGIHAYPDVKSLPRPADLAVICTPAGTVPGIVEDCGEMGTMGIIIISAGFREIGEEGKQLEAEVEAIRRKYEGMRILGPNCLGVIVPPLSMNVSFADAMPGPGRVAVISQSGALCTSILDWAIEKGIGFSYFVSIGNMLDISFDDLIDYFGQDPNTDSIILYVESITNAREFMSATRGFSRTKPIVAYKSGRFAESAQAAASHTGAMAGADDVYDAAFMRAGVERVIEIDDIFECAALLAGSKLPRGPRLAIVTNAGGPGVMATDSLIARDGRLAVLKDKTVSKLNDVLPAFWSHGNPVDVLGDAPPERLAEATKITIKDPNVDAVLVVLTPQAMTDPTGTAREIGRIAKDAKKPILAAWMGGFAVREGIQILNTSGTPTYTTPDQAVQAFMHLVNYQRNLEILYETPKNVHVEFTIDRFKIREQLEPLFKKAGGDGQNYIFSEIETKRLLEAYGIPVTLPWVAESPETAVQHAEAIGYPVVMKIHSPDITHKTDVGGVVLNLSSNEEVTDAYRTMIKTVSKKVPDARIDGVTIQRMFAAKDRFEMIMGAKKDVTFGSVIMVGMGGVAAEVFRDRALGLPPLNESLARRMLESLKSWPLLVGYRGKPGVDLNRLIETIIRFSYLVADFPEIAELDANPLMVTESEVVAVDGRVVVDSRIAGPDIEPYSHLAIRPYPEEYVRPAALKDGAKVLLRPIKPEDEPMWRELFETFSEETIRFRFTHPVKEITRDMITRYCFIDYDREIGIVLEMTENGTEKLIGVGRLIIDTGHNTAQFVAAVGDPWQGRGAGSLLIDYCIRIARYRGIHRIGTKMLPDNEVAIKTLGKRGFVLEEDGDIIRGTLTVEGDFDGFEVP